jgi:hypothetical protein
MDKYSEVEAKFRTNALALDLERVLNHHNDAPVINKHTYHLEKCQGAEGTDTFYQLGTGIVRYRRDIKKMDMGFSQDGGWVHREVSPDPYCCLTVKSRKSTSDMLNRHEVDLWVGNVHPLDFLEFSKMLGGTELFTIKKNYVVYELHSDEAEVCLALYGVTRADGSEPNKFIEIEIEKTSLCSAERGMELLRDWCGFIQDNLAVVGPVNISLFELYSK